MNLTLKTILQSVLSFSFLISWAVTAHSQEVRLGEFSIEIEINDRGKGAYRLDPRHAEKAPSSLPHILAQKQIVSRAQLVFLVDQGVLRIEFQKPVVLSLLDSSHTETRHLDRLLPHIGVELTPRQKRHFEMMFMSARSDLIATMDVLDYELDLKELKDLSRLSAKDFSDGNFFRLPVISKPLKALKLPFVSLHDILEPSRNMTQTNIEVTTLEVLQIHPKTLEINTHEVRVLSLAENMQGLLSKELETQRLVEFRTQALMGRNQLLDQIYSGQSGRDQNPSEPRVEAQILSLPHTGLRCRRYLRNSPPPSSQGATGQVLPFTPRR